jgi:hypothetical protein
MASQYFPNMNKLLVDLDAAKMLEDFFTYPDSDLIANAYEIQVNDTIREVQKACGVEGYILPLKDAKVLFTVHQHLGFLCNSYLDEKARIEWEEELASCDDRWRNLYISKGYPKEVGNRLNVVSDSNAGNFPQMLDYVDLLDPIDLPGKSEFTIYWHLCYLCDSLPDGSEKTIWELRRSKYLAAEQEQGERVKANAHAKQVKASIEAWTRSEMRMKVDEIYNLYRAPEWKRADRAERKTKVLNYLKEGKHKRSIR